MIRHLAIAGIAGLLALTACDGSAEIDEAPAAVAKTPAAPPAPENPPPSAADGVQLKADNTTGTIEFVGAKVTKAHPGGFNTFSGTATISGNAMTATQFEIDLVSMFTDSAKLTKHLLDPDFFDAPQFPKANFESTLIATNDGEGATHTVTGKLSMHGMEKELTFPANITVEGQTAKANAEFSINRKDWGIDYPGRPDDLIKDEVLIKLDLNFGA